MVAFSYTLVGLGGYSDIFFKEYGLDGGSTIFTFINISYFTSFVYTLDSVDCRFLTGLFLGLTTSFEPLLFIPVNSGRNTF
jgi:hypothetical protein